MLVAAVLTVGLLEAMLREDLVLPGIALIACVGAAIWLPWRRTRPLLTTAVVFGSITAVDAAAVVGTNERIEIFALVSVLLFPYALFRWGSGVEAATGMGIVLVTATVPIVIAGTLGDLFGLTILALPAALGASQRYRVSSRQGEADQIRLRERERLARELHDTVAHHVSAIVIRAQAGRAIAPSQPGAAIDALEVIEQAGSRTLADMRALVGALRDGHEAELAPQRGVPEIELLAQSPGPGDTAPSVHVKLAGDLDDLPPLLDAALYRIAQESVTNAVRHARHATRVDVQVTGHGDSVHLTVQDDGDVVPSGAGNSSGYGLIGMRERATLLGGTLHAGPAAHGRWTVTAVLPREGETR